MRKNPDCGEGCKNPFPNLGLFFCLLNTSKKSTNLHFSFANYVSHVFRCTSKNEPYGPKFVDSDLIYSIFRA